MKNILTKEVYLQGIKDRDLSIFAKAITLVESLNRDHQKLAQDLIKDILPLSGKAKRIGVSGTPGVGKSTFLENFGMSLIEQGQKIAVLAVDPTSQITGGSILGDKTRMQQLSASANAFIRPSPNGKTLGGIASKTREVMLLCDAFGFDTIFIETVGVGQSEIAVKSIVDFFILLMQPGSGDELQGIKRGILEVSDLVIVNKADGEQLITSKIAQHDFKSSLAVLQEKNQWHTEVVLCSSINGMGFPEINQNIEKFFLTFFDESNRQLQMEKWIRDLLKMTFEEKLEQVPGIDARIKNIIEQNLDIQSSVENLYQDIK
jgi:LAO/AO transport system kinase